MRQINELWSSLHKTVSFFHISRPFNVEIYLLFLKKLNTIFICFIRCIACNGSHSCGKRCERILLCGHLCGSECHGSTKCGPCENSCENVCIHSRCPKKCKEPVRYYQFKSLNILGINFLFTDSFIKCKSCIEECDWQCEHEGKCPLVCSAPCSRLPCNKVSYISSYVKIHTIVLKVNALVIESKRCSKKLECGHRCPSLCGEDCPSKKFCQTCATKEIKSRIVDMISMASYQAHDVDEDPIIVLPCKHFYSTSTLDGMFRIHDAYEMNQKTLCFTSTKPLIGNLSDSKRKMLSGLQECGSFY